MSASIAFIEKIKNEYHEDGFQIAYNFFIVFSRFECALKESGSYLRRGRYDNAEANWDAFALDIEAAFNIDKNDQLKNAADYILTYPPKVQKFDNGQTRWENRNFTSPSEVVNLCQSIRGIRNNLFHGGKFNGNYQTDTSRNVKLLQSAMIILDEWLLLNDPVGHLFLAPL